jgi:hypothetical protein
MSEQELSLTHRLFAVLERWVKETRVHGIEVVPDPATGAVKTLDFTLDTEVAEVDYSIASGVQDQAFAIDAQTVEIIQALIQPGVNDASMEDLEVKVQDEEVEHLITTEVHDQETSFSSLAGTPPRVHDLFNIYKIKPKMFYSTSVKSVAVRGWTTGVKDLPVGLAARIKENLLLAFRFQVERSPAQVSYVSEKDQLILWKKAVEKSKMEPKALKLIGIYPGVPFYFIQAEKISMNPARKTLTYRFKSKIPRSRDRSDLRDLALFTIISDEAGGKSTSSLVMVKK